MERFNSTNSLDIHEIHEEIFKILCYLDKICSLNNVNYSLFYGTLLGAVRHQNFIPWDDDLDVCLPRKDYNRLREIMKDDQGEFFFLDNKSINYPYLIGRVCLKGTKVIRPDEAECNMGIFVDIYPLDDLGNYYLIVAIKSFILGCLSSMYFASTRTRAEPYVDGKLHKKLFYNLCRLIGSDLIFKLIKLLNKESNNDLKSKYVGCAVWMSPKPLKNIFKLSDITSYCRLVFNGKKFSSFLNFEKVLSQYYGDYNKLPPKNKRFPHHEYTAYRE